MEIIVGKTAGFCYGVKRAVDAAQDILKKEDEVVYCLGEIVHNSQVVRELKDKGLEFIDNINDADSTTIIRAHGVSKEVYERAEKKGIPLCDYTCPNVLKIHKIAEAYSNKGYCVLLFGTPTHPENIGTISYCGDKHFIVEDEEQLFNAIEAINRWNFDKVIVISQTTFDLETFYIFSEILRNELHKMVDLTIVNTICKATEIRQRETKELSKKVDCMIIVGGKNSSNTKKLYYISRENCQNTFCVETVKDLEKQDFSKFNRIGIMAGASTPKKSIEDVCEFLK